MTRSLRLRRRRTLVVAWTVAIIAMVATLFPILWVFTISIKTQRDAFAMPPVLLWKPVWSNYARIWSAAGFARAFANSLAVTAMAVTISLLASVPAAYSLNRFRFRGKRAFSVWLLVSYMFP